MRPPRLASHLASKAGPGAWLALLLVLLWVGSLGADAPAATTTVEVALPELDSVAADGLVIDEGGGFCEITCFKHSCKRPCAQGEFPSCRCAPRTLPTGGIQWLPACGCRTLHEP